MIYALVMIAIVAWVLGFQGVAGAAAWVAVVALFASLLLPVIAGPLAIMLSQVQPTARSLPANREAWWA